MYVLRFMKFESTGLDLQVRKEKGIGGEGGGVVVNSKVIPYPPPRSTKQYSPYSTGNGVRVGYPTRMKSTHTK